MDIVQIVFLDADRLQDSSPEFPQICIVCKKPCVGEDKAFNARSAAIGLGVEFMSTRYFSIPMHTTTNKCAEIFTRKWMLERYRGLGMFILLTLISVGSIPLLGRKSALVLVAGVVSFFALETYFRVKSTLPLLISEAASFKSSLNYKFVFLDASYANEFRRLNKQFLADLLNG